MPQTQFDVTIPETHPANAEVIEVDSISEYIKNNSANETVPAEEPVAEPAQNDKQEPAQDTTQEPTQEPSELELSFMDVDDSGNKIFNPGKAKEFYDSNIIEKPKPLIKETPPQTQTTQEPAKEPDKFESARNNINDVMGILDKYMGMYDNNFEVAKLHANKEIDDIIKYNALEDKLNSRDKDSQKREKEIERKASLLEKQPTFQRNLAEIASAGRWGSTKTLVDALRNPEHSGAAIQQLFIHENPDAQYSSKEEYDKAWNDWIVDIGSNKALLQFFSRYAMLEMREKHQKYRDSKVKESAIADYTQKRKTITKSQGRRITQPIKKAGIIDNWLNKKFG